MNARIALSVSAQPVAASAAEDQAISQDMLEQVASGESPGALRIWRPVPALALSRLDELRPGAGRARELARTAGFDTARRVSGGHAVVLGRGSFCVGFAEPAVSFEGTQLRYRRLVSALIGTFAGLGVEAQQAELPDEWCPGAWSICSGTVKLAGLAQRAIRGAAWAEAVIELARDDAARALFPQVYAALDLPLATSTLGSLSEIVGRELAFEDLAEPLEAALST